MGKMTVDGDLTGLDRCPRCQIAKPQLSPIWLSAHLEEPGDNLRARQWAAVRCSSCGNLLLAQCRLVARPNPGHGFVKDLNVERIFPEPIAVDEALPPSARSYLRQALETLHAPDAAAVMAASSIDAMLKDQGLKEGSLYSRIDEAVSEHLLTEGMGKWAHAVRLEANNVRHADEEHPHVTPEQAQQVVEFAKALGDFLYVLTAKIKKGVKAAAEAPEGKLK